MKNRHDIIILAIILGLVLLSAGCTRAPLGAEPSVTAPQTAISDPAAAYCTDMNNRLEIRKNPDGSEYGVCILADSTECDPSDYYHGTCPASTTPESQNLDTGAAISDPAAAYCTDMNNRLEIRKNPDGSEYGVCILADSTECDPSDYYHGTCPASTTPESQNLDTGAAISDPAAAYCTDMNNRLEIRKNPDGSEYGVCTLADGTECDAMAYFEGTCPNAPAAEVTPLDETITSAYEALCRAKNFPYEIKVNPDGSEHGVCIFPDGRECDARAYYLGDCSDETALEP